MFAAAGLSLFQKKPGGLRLVAVDESNSSMYARARRNELWRKMMESEPVSRKKAVAFVVLALILGVGLGAGVTHLHYGTVLADAIELEAEAGRLTAKVTEFRAKLDQSTDAVARQDQRLASLEKLVEQIREGTCVSPD